MMGWPYIKNKTIKMIPARLWYCCLLYLVSYSCILKETEPAYALVKIGSLLII